MNLNGKHVETVNDRNHPESQALRAVTAAIEPYQGGTIADWVGLGLGLLRAYARHPEVVAEWLVRLKIALEDADAPGEQRQDRTAWN